MFEKGIEHFELESDRFEIFQFEKYEKIEYFEKDHEIDFHIDKKDVSFEVKTKNSLNSLNFDELPF